ncbi:MAG TPA: Rrf2 family transcriptional regulator [Phenylobacterium sp.]|nr:Rrf2 family transcriptional regulator [Phenylobacterium sp.]
MKVAYELGQAGFVDTVRGRNGGLRLGREPEAIGLGDVVRHAEPDMDLAPCFAASATVCAIQPACRLRSVLFEASKAFLEVLDGYILGDLVANRDQLAALLAAGPPARGGTPIASLRSSAEGRGPPRRQSPRGRPAGGMILPGAARPAKPRECGWADHSAGPEETQACLHRR